MTHGFATFLVLGLSWRSPPRGGVHGYYNLLEAIAIPKPRNYHELLEWLGEAYDPAAFDPDALNGLLKKLKL